jgi:hypothetical protein
MSRDAVTIELDRDPPDYLPDESLSGRWTVAVASDDEVRSAELSVLWYTDGKGEEDLGVHHFERLSADEAGSVGSGRGRRFALRLPRAPLSYDGVIVKVCWCVRVRVFWDGGESVAEVPFRLGEVATACEIAT